MMKQHSNIFCVYIINKMLIWIKYGLHREMKLGITKSGILHISSGHYSIRFERNA